LFELSDAALRHQGGSRAALFELLKSDRYVPLTLDEDTGAPVPWASVNSPLSHNIVAVHQQRDFGLLPKLRWERTAGPRAGGGKKARFHS
jgi:hypothetical protein